MGAVIAIISFGLGLIGAGVFWRMLNDMFLKYIAKYVYNASDPYYLANDLVWNAIPFVIIIVGVLVVVMGGLMGRTVYRKVKE